MRITWCRRWATPSCASAASALIAADSPNAFLDNTPTAKLVRQLLGAIAEFDKAMTVAKLRSAQAQAQGARQV